MKIPISFKRIKPCILALLVAMIATSTNCSRERDFPHGLYIEDGQLMRQGSPFRAMGINYFDCFLATLKNERTPEFIDGFRILKEDYKIPFVRFMAGPYAHTDWHLYVDDPDAYFAKLDRVVRAAEEAGIGLIPSLFWYVVTMPDLAGEPVSALGDKDSRCRAFMRQYIHDVVGRYVDSPAIWGWEAGNEWLLAADLPKYNHLPRKKIGSDQERTPADKLLRPMILDAYIDIYHTIRSLDPDRIIMTGDSIARAHAWHNRNKDAWGQDTRAQWHEIFRADTPDCYKVTSFHIYAEADKGYYKDDVLTLEEFVADVIELCRKDGQLIWCGELGMPGTDDDAREMFFRMMHTMEVNEVDISAIWNFKLRGTAQAEWDISPDNERAYMLDAVKDLNKRFAIGAWK